MLLCHIHSIRVRKLIASVPWRLIAWITIILKSTSSTLRTCLNGETTIIILLWKNYHSVCCVSIYTGSLLNCGTTRELCTIDLLSRAWNSCLISDKGYWLKSMSLLIIWMRLCSRSKIRWASSWARSMINLLWLNWVKPSATWTIISVVWFLRS